MRYRFGDFELNEELYELRRGERAVDLQPKALNLLVYLLQNRERTPSKDELLDTLWPGVAVGEASLTRAVRAVRRALLEHATEPGVLRTVRGRGYRIGVPVEVVLDAADAAEPTVNSPERTTGGAFVGREAELARLRAGLDDALSGHPRILMLVGDPGVGKTRTAEELAKTARQVGAQVLWGHCYEGKGAPAFWPWHQVLRDYAHTCTSEMLRSQLGPAAADLASLVPELHRTLPDLPEPPTLEPREARLRLFDGVVGFLRRASATKPLAIILDDLHGADEASLLLLEYLAAELHSVPLLVLGTYRDAELRGAHRLTTTLAELARRGQSQRIQLGALGSEEVTHIIAQTSRVSPSVALAEAVFRKTEGNAFFVHEVVRMLASDGRLDRAEQVGSWKVEIPRGVREVLSHRLDQVGNSCRLMLRSAAVLGREFEIRVLERMVEVPEEAWLTALDEALAARLIEDVGERYRFAHTLIRETLYDELHAARRVHAHRRAGEAMEEVHEGCSGRHQAEIAHHFYQARFAVGQDRAVDAAVKAGDWAHTQFAYEDAAYHYRSAIETVELADAPDAGRLCELLVQLARLEHWAGDRAAMLKTIGRAIEGARRINANELFADAVLVAYAMGGIVRMGRVDATAVARLEEALELLGPDDCPLRARLLNALALQLNHDRESSYERRAQLRREARAIATRLGADALLFDVTAGQGEGAESSAISIDGKIEELLPFAEESVRLARGLGTRSRFFALALRSTMRLVAGDMQGSRADSDACGPLGDELRTAGSRYVQLSLQIMRTSMDGRFDEVEKLASEAFGFGKRARAGLADTAYAIQMFQIQLHRDTLRREDNRATEIIADRGFGLARAILARRCAAQGAREEAAYHYGLLVARDFEAVSWGLARTNSLCLLADVCVYLGDTGHALQLYERMRPYPQYHTAIGAPVGHTYLGSFAMRLGMLATQLGHFPDAETYFRSAIEWSELAGVRPWRAHAQVEYARLLLKRDEAGDRELAHEQVDAALDLGREIGMPALEREAATLDLVAS